jgi:hypothetical protein
MLGGLRFVFLDPRPSALRRTGLPQDQTRPPLAYPELLPDNHHAPPPPLGAQKFPLAASFRIRLSTVRSATARFRRADHFASIAKVGSMTGSTPSKGFDAYTHPLVDSRKKEFKIPILCCPIPRLAGSR